MVRFHNLVALAVVAMTEPVLSAPRAVGNGRVKEAGFSGGSEFSSANSKHGSLVRPVAAAAKPVGDVVPGEEKAVAVFMPARKAKEGDWRRINIINATPYRFVRKGMHEYQIEDWPRSWPKYIEPGQVHESVSKMYGGHHRRDTGAEVTYEIEGTCEKMSFEIIYNKERAELPTVRVQFKGGLKTRWTPKGSEIELTRRVVWGGVNFLLAGTEDDFYSMDGPVGWMQEQIKDIGDYPLNQIVMPRSHHAGMNQGRTGVGIVYDETTLTQTKSPYEQMKVGGARVLDFRPYLRTGRMFSAGHFSVIAGLHHGMIGINLKEIIDDINRFLDENPGEMIIVDFHDKESWMGFGEPKFGEVNEEWRRLLWKELERLNHRFALPDDVMDIHKMTLNDFVGDGQSTVLIHVPDQWIWDKHFPGAHEGYVSNRNFPRTGYWSDTEHGETLVAEQGATIEQKKSNGRGGQIHDAQWVLRLATVQYVFPVLPLWKLAREAWGRLYVGMWSAINDEKYPNWISFDAFETEEAKILAMTMNRCLVAGKCGKLGGKAPSAEPLELKCAKKGD